MVNANASSVTARKRVLIQRILSGNHDVEVAETRRRGHATRLALAAARRDLDVVVALGGDGTLNEVANGLVGTDTAMALLPGGSTNVVARTIGLPEDPVHAALSLVDSLHDGSIIPISLGSANGRYFVFHVGAGWDAALVSVVERHGALKRYLNHALFTYAGIVTFFGGVDRSSPWYRLSEGGRSSEGWLCVVLNSNPYTFVGPRPFNAGPDAGFDRPLVVLSVQDFGTPPMLRLIADALRPGARVASNPAVDYRTDVTDCVIEALRPLPWQVDGDYLGTTDRLEIRHHPDAARLVVPTEYLRQRSASAVAPESAAAAVGAE